VSHTDPIVLRLPLIARALAAALLLAGCGGSGGSSSSASAGSVRLAIAAPQDMASVRDGSVQIRGTVRPAGAIVTVHGRRATTSGGSWSASVGLEPGVNVVDVLASSGAAKPALTAVRVRRIVDIQVPDVTGLNADDATQELEDAHLTAKTETDNGSFFDDLLGGDPQVCSTDPEAGTSVDPGTTITIQLARRC
jgi:PASTA domain/Glucodextranase, domain B